MILVKGNWETTSRSAKELPFGVAILHHFKGGLGVEIFTRKKNWEMTYRQTVQNPDIYISWVQNQKVV